MTDTTAATRDGVHDAVMELMAGFTHGAGWDHPWCREDILAAVRDGVHDAFVELLGPMDKATGDDPPQTTTTDDEESAQ
jgi:hypothetical protein